MFDRLGARSQTSVEKITVKNVMNPILWICGLISLPSLGFIFYSEREPSWVISFLAIVPPTFALVIYTYFALKSPDRLQSEGYQLKKQVIDLIEEKGSLAPVDARSLELISNPDSIRIESQPTFPDEEKVIDKGFV